MKTPLLILSILVMLLSAALTASSQTTSIKVDFFGETIDLPADFKAPSFTDSLDESTVRKFIVGIDSNSIRPFLAALLHYKSTNHPDDWLYYQLVRKVAQTISPKAENYYRYTFYKWWLLTQSGYDARLTIAGRYLLFYVQSDENIYNVPSRTIANKQYVCLNYHDYGSIDFTKHRFEEVTTSTVANAKPFSYKVQQLPDFKQTDYAVKEVQFTDGLNHYSFQIKLNPQVKTIFTNYPVVDYDLQFNMPLSKTTYESLIPSLKKELKGMKEKEGVSFLMRFTRYAFLFKPDAEVFGSEKRLTPEQTLLYEYSDCEDRAGLFFFLVKEIYNLPMLVLTYPAHVTVAVQFEKPYGKTIEYNGMKYSVCEPSPQRIDLNVGQSLPELSKQSFQIAYAYRPSGN